jgi:nitrate/nitrite transporter NarK
MRLDPSVRTRGDLIEPFRLAQIAYQVAGNGSNALGLTGHLGNVGSELARLLPPVVIPQEGACWIVWSSIPSVRLSTSRAAHSLKPGDNTTLLRTN